MVSVPELPLRPGTFFCPACLSLMALTTLLALGVLSGALAAPEGSASPWDHDRPELDPARASTVTPGKRPVLHEAFFRGERELLGYDPRFLPTSGVAFDLDNRPYIRAALPDREEGDGSRDGAIQFPDDMGRWRILSIPDAIRRKYPGWEGTYATGVRDHDTRVASDPEGGLYTVVHLNKPRPVNLLLYWPALTADVQVYEVALSGARLEPPAAAGVPRRVPMLLGFAGGRLALSVVSKERGGSLSLGAPITLAPAGCDLNPNHSGAGPALATVGDRTYVVYSSNTPVKNRGERINGVPFDGKALLDATTGENHPGTAQYVISYNHATGEVSVPVLLGFGQNAYTPAPDVHNGPTVLADSSGGLHVLLGAHQHHFWYLRSKHPAPQSRDDWTDPIAVGTRRHYDCGLTYTAFAIDSKDTLHLVARNLGRDRDADGAYLPPDQWRSANMMRTLDYFRAPRRADDTWQWEERGSLVVPYWHKAYSIFYQKLSVDRLDRLFLTYYYYAAQLSSEEIAAYRTKWPDERVPEAPDPGRLWMRPHDPVILVSDDGGDTWRVAQTPDFAAGIQPAAKPADAR